MWEHREAAGADMRPNVIDFLAVQAFSGPVQTDCGRSAPKVGVKVAIAAATGAYRLSSENVLLPRAARSGVVNPASFRSLATVQPGSTMRPGANTRRPAAVAC